jgi:hypothetical protein
MRVEIQFWVNMRTMFFFVCSVLLLWVEVQLVLSGCFMRLLYERENYDLFVIQVHKMSFLPILKL